MPYLNEAIQGFKCFQFFIVIQCKIRKYEERKFFGKDLQSLEKLGKRVLFVEEIFTPVFDLHKRFFVK